MRSLLALIIIRCSSSAWQPALISNTELRKTRAGLTVGAQDGNLVAVPPAQGGGFALVGMSYGDCPFTACKNTTVGNCGFGAGAIHAWRSASLGQDDWSAPAELLPAAQRPAGTYVRPHLIYNAATFKWVLWVRWLCCGSGSLAQQHTTYLSATAERLEGPYTVAVSNVSMYWPDSADDNLFVDDDGVRVLFPLCSTPRKRHYCVFFFYAHRL